MMTQVNYRTVWLSKMTIDEVVVGISTCISMGITNQIICYKRNKRDVRYFPEIN